MSVVINTNVDALKIQNVLTSSTNKLSQSMQRMSSGLKINSAKDDAAGTVISARMNVQIDGNNIAQKNVQNASSLLSTAEGNIDVVLENISRIRDLTLQAKNGTYSESEIQAMQDEVDQRIQEINRVSESAKFSQLDLFGGSLATTGVSFQVGTNATSNDVIEAGADLFKSVKFNDILTSDVDREAITSFGAAGANFVGSFTDSSNMAASIVDEDGNPLEGAVGKIYYNTEDSNFYVAKETSTGVYEWVEGKVDKTLIKDGAAAAAGDVGKICKITTDDKVEYKLCTAFTDAEHITYADKALKNFDPVAENAKGTKAGSSVYSDTYKFDLTTMDESTSKSFTQAINALDKAVDNLTNRKSLVGSLGNRLDSALNTLTTQQANLTSAKSIITDADIAAEAATFTQNQILQQVSTSLLAQANQAPSIALSLL